MAPVVLYRAVAGGVTGGDEWLLVVNAVVLVVLPVGFGGTLLLNSVAVIEKLLLFTVATILSYSTPVSVPLTHPVSVSSFFSTF